MDRNDHGKAGKQKPVPWSRETPPKLGEEPQCWGDTVLMQRGLRADTGVKSAQATATALSSVAGGDGRLDALVVRRAHALRNKALVQQNRSAPAARGGEGVVVSYHISRLGLFSSAVLLTCGRPL